MTATDLFNLYRESNPNVRYGSLGGYDRIDLDWVDDDGDQTVLRLIKDGQVETELIGSDANDWVNAVMMEHLQSIYSSNIDVLNMPFTTISVERDGIEGDGVGDDEPIINYESRIGRYTIDMKDFYHTGTFHGSANYQLERPPSKSDPDDTGIKTKMRSYEKKRGNQRALVLDDGDEMCIGDRYDEESSSGEFLRSLREPEIIERPDLFARTNILKTKEYTHKIKQFDQSDLVPGDNIVRLGFIKEWSITQHTYQSLDQYKSIQKQFEQLRNKYGQSYERHFLNEDGTLRYQEMVETIDCLIQSGVTNIERALDKHRHCNRTLELKGLSVNATGYDAWKKAKKLVEDGMIAEDDVLMVDDEGEFDMYDDEDWRE
ncbi:MAG: hypothetical protein HQL54_03255 [Magnetococcales bacterium]|nr:hypothetical protein [Magnetococcales bacterium]